MNIYDIAKKAGMSISTVSRVLNHKTNVTPTTRKKIEAILKEYNYSPNAIARGLVSNSMETIAVVTVDIRVPHYAKQAYTVEQAFSSLGYNVLVCNTGGKLNETKKYMKMLSEKQIDGVVLVGSVFNDICKDPEIVTYLKNLPVVTANGKVNLPLSYSVLVDDSMGISLAVDYLYKKGHRNIAYVKDLNTDSANRKEQGFYSAMKSHGCTATEENILKTSYGFKGGQEAANLILSHSPRYSAAVFGEDLTAIGAIKTFQKAGLQIPDDIAITGYNDSEYTTICSPELTSIDNKPELVGQCCVQLLVNMIAGKTDNASIVIQPELKIRESA
jgi:LacI family transcriptional regulator